MFLHPELEASQQSASSDAVQQALRKSNADRDAVSESLKKQSAIMHNLMEENSKLISTVDFYKQVSKESRDVSVIEQLHRDKNILLKTIAELNSEVEALKKAPMASHVLPRQDPLPGQPVSSTPKPIATISASVASAATTDAIPRRTASDSINTLSVTDSFDLGDLQPMSEISLGNFTVVPTNQPPVRSPAVTAPPTAAMAPAADGPTFLPHSGPSPSPPRVPSPKVSLEPPPPSSSPSTSHDESAQPRGRRQRHVAFVTTASPAPPSGGAYVVPAPGFGVPVSPTALVDAPSLFVPTATPAPPATPAPAATSPDFGAPPPSSLFTGPVAAPPRRSPATGKRSAASGSVLPPAPSTAFLPAEPDHDRVQTGVDEPPLLDVDTGPAPVGFNGALAGHDGAPNGRGGFWGSVWKTVTLQD